MRRKQKEPGCQSGPSELLRSLNPGVQPDFWLIQIQPLPNFHELHAAHSLFPGQFRSLSQNAGDGVGVMETLEYELAPRTVKIIVDYCNVSDMRFTAEFEIRATYAWEEAHTFLVERYFNPA